MNSILATEPSATATAEKSSTLPSLESWATNERMRHIPSPEWMSNKLDGDVRRRVQKLSAVLADLPRSDARHAVLETAFRPLCRALERVCDAVRSSARHPGHGPVEVPARIESLLAHAVAGLRSLESTPFGHRHPYHFFDRSRAEPVYASLLSVIAHLESLVTAVRVIDPDIDERLLEGLVVLQNPVDERMLRPIA